MMNSTQHHDLMKNAWSASHGGIAALIVFGAFINLLKFAMPLYTLQILDRVPESRSVETLVMLSIIALLAVISGVLLESVRKRMLSSWSGWLNRYLGPQLVQSAIDAPDDGKSQSTPSNLLNNLQTVREFIEKSLAPMFDLLWVPLFVITVFMIHPLFGGLITLMMMGRLASGFVQNQLTRPSRQQWSDASRDAKHMIDTVERNADSIGAAAMSQRLSERWLERIRTKLSERERSLKHDNLFAAINTGLYRVLYVLGMGLGVWLVVQNLMTIGGVIAVNIIMRFGFRLLDRGIRRWESLSRSYRAYQRLNRHLQSCKTTKPREIMPSDLQAPLFVERVSYRHPGQSESIMRKVELVLSPGELLTVIGNCASGKSTFARLVSGTIAPRSGHIRLGDMELSMLPASQRHQMIGYMPQEARLFSGSVRDNISLLHDCPLEQVMEAAKLSGIHERIIRLPQGYETMVDDKTHWLSVGESRLLLIARALFGQPRLVVLDEPEAHLDSQALKHLCQSIEHLKHAGCTLVITSQSNWLVDLTDKTFLLPAKESRASLTRLRTSRMHTTHPVRVGESS